MRGILRERTASGRSMPTVFWFRNGASQNRNLALLWIILEPERTCLASDLPRERNAALRLSLGRDGTRGEPDEDRAGQCDERPARHCVKT